MKWRKIGLLYCPEGEQEWARSHAAVPVAEQVRGDHYRVYFSARDQLNRSQTGYLDLDLRHPKAVLTVCKEPILTPGPLGTFDESGAMLSWIASYNSKKYYYYIGWNLATTVPFRNAIGLAIGSNDLSPPIKYARGPIVDRSIYDPCFTASCCVLVEEQIWRMWYLSCVDWDRVGGQLQHRYHIKYAESLDGIEWIRKGITCIDFKSEREYAISRPSVIKDGTRYKMWYSYRGDRYRIGYAESLDGIEWERMDEKAGIDVSSSGWDAEMVEYPFVFDHAGQRYMLYNGNGYGKSGFGMAILEDDD